MEKIIDLLEQYHFTSVREIVDSEGRKVIVANRDWVTLSLFRSLDDLPCVYNIYFSDNEISVYYE